MRLYFPNGVLIDLSVAELRDAGVDLRRATCAGDVVEPECGREHLKGVPGLRPRLDAVPPTPASEL